VNSERLRDWKCWFLAVVATVVVGRYLHGWWTQPPAVEFDNLKYVQLLRTAVSARNSNWLAGVEKAVELRAAEGKLSDPEREHFGHVVALARDDRWDDADRAAYEFEAAQLSRRRSFPPGGDFHAHHEH
jgi:hypothetical protein